MALLLDEEDVSLEIGRLDSRIDLMERRLPPIHGGEMGTATLSPSAPAAGLLDSYSPISAYDNATPPAFIGTGTAIAEGDHISITKSGRFIVIDTERALWPCLDAVVAEDGTGTHTTIQAAITSAIAASGNFYSIGICGIIDEGTIELGGLNKRVLLLGMPTFPLAPEGSFNAASQVSGAGITTPTGEDMFVQTTDDSSTSGIAFVNLGLENTNSGRSIVFISTTAEINYISFDGCHFMNGTGGGDILSGDDGTAVISLLVQNCSGDANYVIRQTTVGQTTVAARLDMYNNHMTLTSWYIDEHLGSSQHIQGGTYDISVGQVLPVSADVVQFQNLVITFRESGGDLFSSPSAATVIDDLSFINIVMIGAIANCQFGNFGANDSSVANHFFDGIHGISTLTQSGTFLTLDTDMVDWHVGDIHAPDWTTLYSGPPVSGGGGLLGSRIEDVDGDTSVDTETTADEDIIRLRAAGTELMTIGFEGAVEILHTASASDEHALELIVDDAGFGDVSAIDIDYITGAIVDGEDEEVILVNIDESAAVGGAVVALEVLATEGSANIHAVEAAALVGPVLQLSGVFVNMASALVKAVDSLTEFTTSDPGGANNVDIFVANGDTVTIGNATKFEELEFLLEVAASVSLKTKFEFSSGAGPAYTEFFPADGTNGFRNTGVIAWEDDDIPTWVAVGGEFLIRLTREKGGNPTIPTEDKVQIASVTVYEWDKDGDLDVRNIALSGTLTLGGDAQLSRTAADTLSLASGDEMFAQRMLLGNDVLTGSGGLALAVAEVSTATSGTIQLSGCQLDADPGSSSSAEYRVLTFLADVIDGASAITGTILGIAGQVRGASANAIATAIGARLKVDNTGAGDITTGIGLRVESALTGAGDITNYTGLRVDAPADSGAGAYVTVIGIDLRDFATGTTIVSMISRDADATMRHVGGIKIGSTGAPSVALDVTGAGIFSSNLEIDGALNHDGSTIGFFGTAPVVQAGAAYIIANGAVDRAYDADATSVEELADVLGTLIADLQTYGLLQ